MSGTSRSILLAIAILLTLSSAGCVRYSKTSKIDELESKIEKLERRTEDLEESLRINERMASLESRLALLSRPVTMVPASAQAVTVPAVAAPASALQAEAAPVAAVPGAVLGTTRTRDNRGMYGGEYRQGIATDPPNIDPARLSDTTSHRVGMTLFEGLVEFSEEDLSVVPLIASSWDVSEDGTVFTFKIRDDVKFHNGRLVTAEDFVYSYSRMLDPKTAAERAWLFEEVLGYKQFEALLAARGQLKFVVDGNFAKVELKRVERALKSLEVVTRPELERSGVSDVDGVLEAGERARIKMEEVAEAARQGQDALGQVKAEPELMTALKTLNGLQVRDFISRGLTTPDSHTLRIELRRPFAPFLSILAMPNAAVVPKEEAEKWGDQFSQHPVGTGPFQFVSWTPHVSVEVKAFDDYFLGRPYVDSMRFRVIPDTVARLYEFQVGNLESINQIADEKYESIKANTDFPGVLQEKATLNTYYMGFNVTLKPFDNKLVRQAFNYAIRKDTIVNVIRRGRGSVAEGVLPPGLPSYNPELKGYSYNKQKAIELLKEAGYEDRSKLGVIEYWYNATGPNDPNAKLAEVIQQNLREIGVETKLQSTDWGTYLKKLDRGELAMFRLGWVADYPDADNFMYILFHSSMHGEAGNHTYFANAEVDELLEKGRTTADREKRTAYYRRAEEIIVEEAPWIFLYHAKQTFLHKPYVKGATLTGMGPDATQLRHAWLDKDAQGDQD